MILLYRIAQAAMRRAGGRASCVPSTFQNLNDDEKTSPRIQIKPDFVFFGESIRQEAKDRRYVAQQELWICSAPDNCVESYAIVEGADRILILGTTLATYSAFRYVSPRQYHSRNHLM